MPVCVCVCVCVQLVIMSLSGRPASAARNGPRRPYRSKTDCWQEPLSYEDIIIAKYLDELCKPPPHTKIRYL